MKLCDISYEEALKRHPTEVGMLIAKLRKGKSKERNAPVEDLRWHYECCVMVKGHSLGEMLAGKSLDDRAHLVTVEDQVADRVRNTRSTLQATLRRWRDTMPVPNPPEVGTQARASFEKEFQERATYDGLSEKEKRRQLEDNIKEASKMPGFMVLHVRRE
jgi:hypothetical protein